MNGSSPTCISPADWPSMPSQCWYDWQSLIGGILAIVAAFVGAWLLYKQIRQVERHENERRNRRIAAVRATLPLILSGICQFAREMINELSSARTQLGNGTTIPTSSSFSPPPVPTAFVAALQDMIEATGDTAIVDLLSEIIGEIQVLSARAGSLIDVRSRGIMGVGSNLDEYLVQAARLHALAGGLFEYARRRDEDAPSAIAWDRVASALHASHVDDHTHPGAFAILTRRMNAWQSVWPKHRVEEVSP